MCIRDSPEEEASGSKAKAGPNSTKEGGKGKKRSGEDIIEREKERSKKAKEAATQKAEWFELKQNTSVYVSGLPSDVTEEEVAQVSTHSAFILTHRNDSQEICPFKAMEIQFILNANLCLPQQY